MTTHWVDEEEGALWGQFLRGPEAVVTGIPRRHTSLDKFPRNSVLPVFFNAYPPEYPLKDNPKTGLECCNRVRGLLQNQANHQQVLELRDPADTMKSESLFAICQDKLSLEVMSLQRTERLWGHVCKTLLNDPKLVPRAYTEEQRTMCEVRGCFAWKHKKPGQDVGVDTVEYLVGTSTKMLVGVGPPKVVSILEDIAREWC